MLTDETLAKIVHRIFLERRSTLLAESAKFQATDLANTCLGLREQMLSCLERLPALAFKAEPGRQPGEAGWTAGEIVSTNSDRLVWALTEAASTIEVSDSNLPRPPEVVVNNSSYEPQLLDRDIALEVLQAANDYLKAVLPLLLSTDRGQTAARTHHGSMSVKSWLLLICIHDNDHLGQLRARHDPSTSDQYSDDVLRQE